MIPCTCVLQEKLVARRLYNILFCVLLPGLLARMWWRGRRAPAYRQRILERLSFVLPDRRYDIWVHAVSVGETLAAVPLVRKLLEVHPELSIIVTNMTPTGAERAQALLGNQVGHHYLPWDVLAAQQRWLAAIHPRLLIVMETELWPNMLWAAHLHGVKVVLANARLSQRSAQAYGRWPALVSPMLSCLDKVAAQERATAERFIQLGVPQDRVEMTGSLKFDMPQSSLNRTELRTRWHVEARVIWVAGSTHEGEEAFVLDAFRGLLTYYPEALLMLVPRHPERFGDVERLLNLQHWRYQRRSVSEVIAKDTQVWLADSMGELMQWYAMADIALVAGSLLPHLGGHNMLEPLGLGVPTLSGPFVLNFQTIAEELVAAGALQITPDVASLTQACQVILTCPEDAAKGVQAGKAILSRNRGALQRHLQIIDELLLAPPVH